MSSTRPRARPDRATHALDHPPRPSQPSLDGDNRLRFRDPAQAPAWRAATRWFTPRGMSFRPELMPREQMAWESCWLTMSRRGASSVRLTFHLAWSPWRITWLHEGRELVVRGRRVSDAIEKAMAWAEARRSVVPPAPPAR